MAKTVLAADLGGTNLRVSLVGEDGTVSNRMKVPTPSTGSSADIVYALATLATECREKAGSQQAPAAFGVAAAAIVDWRNGTIFSSPNMPELNGLDIASRLTERLGIPVLLENDANAAAVGECWLGASRGVENSICVTLGTGVGGGLILGGRVHRGADGTAGEVGHINVEIDGHPCGCGSWGCLEQYASATAIVRIAGELESKFPDSPVAKLQEITSASVYDAGKAGDPLSLEVFRRVGTYLGISLAGLINVLNPEVIVIGGGASAGWDLFIGYVHEQIAKRAFREPGERARIVRAELGDDAGILGAAKLALGSP